MKKAAKKTTNKLSRGFTYHGGMVFEIDSKGVKHPRRDIGPGYKGDFRHKFK